MLSEKDKSSLGNEEKEAVEQQPCDAAVMVEEVQTDSDTADSPIDSKESPVEAPQPLYSTFTKGQKIAITLTVSFLAIISPLSGQIYLPALDSIAHDLQVPISYVNLTITTFMVLPWCPT